MSVKTGIDAHRGREDGSLQTCEHGRKLLLDLLRKPPGNGRAPGAALIGRVPQRAACYAVDFGGRRDVAADVEPRLARFSHFAVANMMTLTTIYADPATSGGSVVERPGFLEMLNDARAGAFDVLLADDVHILNRGLFAVWAFEFLDGRNIPLVEVPYGRIHTKGSFILLNHFTDAAAAVHARNAVPARSSAPA